MPGDDRRDKVTSLVSNGPTNRINHRVKDMMGAEVSMEDRVRQRGERRNVL